MLRIPPSLTNTAKDILHSYLGLAALATMREPELKSLDAMLCISVGAREGLEGVWGR